jgi:hypothetical protein
MSFSAIRVSTPFTMFANNSDSTTELLDLRPDYIRFKAEVYPSFAQEAEDGGVETCSWRYEDLGEKHHNCRERLSMLVRKVSGPSVGDRTHTLSYECDTPSRDTTLFQCANLAIDVTGFTLDTVSAKISLVLRLRNGPPPLHRSIDASSCATSMRRIIISIRTLIILFERCCKPSLTLLPQLVFPSRRSSLLIESVFSSQNRMIHGTKQSES